MGSGGCLLGYLDMTCFLVNQKSSAEVICWSMELGGIGGGSGGIVSLLLVYPFFHTLPQMLCSLRWLKTQSSYDSTKSISNADKLLDKKYRFYFITVCY